MRSIRFGVKLLFISLCISFVSTFAQTVAPTTAPAVPAAVPPAAPAAVTPASTPAPAASATVAPASPVVTPAPAAPVVPAAPAVQAKPAESPKKHFEAAPAVDIQNTSLEGIQISHEPGNKADEVIVSGYFIFKEKPASYFYEVKQAEKKIVFEFNDTKSPAAPIPQVAEPPIQKFTVEQRKIDINKDIRGIKPEFHSQVRVTLFLDNIPDIHVNDQANVILFSYKWTTDPLKVSKYVLKPSSHKWVKYAVGGAVVAGVGAAVALKGGKNNSANSDISISDLPVHAQPAQ